MKSNGHQMTLHSVTLISRGLDCRNSWLRKGRMLMQGPCTILEKPKEVSEHPKSESPGCTGQTNANAAAAPSKAEPKKTDIKSPPKGKSKGHGKPLGVEEKAKTPCIFHQMQSGCVHGAKCAYSHSKAPPPKPKSEGNADPKPEPKTAPAAAAKTLAIVAILAATMLRPSQAGLIEWAADSGAGRHVVFFEALSDQRYDHPSLMVSLSSS